MNWYIKVLNQYFDFKGRARRTEYWMFTLVSVIISWSIIGFSLAIQSSELNILEDLYSLAVLIPSLAVSVRRLHDIGKSGWNLLLVLIPFIGAIILLVWMCEDSQHGTNKWGKNPKGPGNDLEINQIGRE